MFKFFKCWFFLMRLATTLEVQMDTSLAKTPCDDWVIRMWRRLVECVANIKVQFFQLRGMQQAIAEFCQAFVRGNVLWLDYYLFHGSNFGLLTAMEKTKLRKVQFFLKPSQNASTSLSPKFQLNKVNFCKFEFGNALAILSKTGSKLAFWLSFLQYFYALIYFGDALTAIEVICKFWRVLLFSKADWTTSVFIGVPFFCIPCAQWSGLNCDSNWNKKMVRIIARWSSCCFLSAHGKARQILHQARGF